MPLLESQVELGAASFRQRLHCPNLWAVHQGESQQLRPLLIAGKNRRPNIIMAHVALLGRSRPSGGGVTPGRSDYVRFAVTTSSREGVSTISGTVTHTVIQEKLTLGHSPVSVARCPDDGGACRVGHVSYDRRTSPVRQLSAHRPSRCGLPCHAASLNSRSHCRGSTLLLGPEPPESDGEVAFQAYACV